MFRFTIRDALLWTAGLGASIALGAFFLRNASQLWCSTLAFYGTLSILLVALLVAINRQGSTRAFWAGFAIFGLAYLHLTLTSGQGNMMRPELARPENLVTTKISERAYIAFYTRPSPNLPAGVVPSVFTTVPVSGRPFVAIDDFTSVANLGWSFLIGLCAGWVSVFIFIVGKRKTNQLSSDSAAA
jgi:hypothetical protein